MDVESEDLRRAAGRRTRDRLLGAALELVADRGTEAVTLREVTDVAGANIAAVSYHFGSLGALCDAAIEGALEEYLDRQIRAIAELAPGAGIDDLAAAFARPMVAALAAGGRDLAIIRTVARVGTDPPDGWDRMRGKFEQSRRDALRVLQGSLPAVAADDLIFRIRCGAGILNWLALAPIGAELGGRSEAEIERLLLPVLAGALRGYDVAV